MKKFNSIEQFKNVIKNVRKHYSFINEPIPVLNFTGTCKLHGCNASIRRNNGVFSAQSRERVLTLDDDNYGFAKFVDALPKDKLNELFDKISDSSDVTIFGEWIGQGIQKNVAVSQLPKQFVIFKAWDNVTEKYIKNSVEWKVEEVGIYNILQVPQYDVEIDFNFPDKIADTLVKLTLDVENECPWGKKFNVIGIGEGIVWCASDQPEDERFWFKTKGEKHGNKGAKSNLPNIAPVNTERLNTINELVACVLPDWRLEQGITSLKEQGIEIDMKNLSAYLKWIGQDVKKEQMDIIEASGLDWKDISNAITLKAKNYFMQEFKNLTT